MFDIFENSDCWFLESFKINGNQLTIGIAEGIISSAKEDVRIDKNTKIDGCSPIVVNEESRKFEIRFFNVLSHQLTDESYAAPESGQIEGKVLCLHKDSSYLKHVLENSLISHLIEGSVFHYSLNLADDIIDIITTEKPEMR